MVYQFPPDVDRLVKDHMDKRGYATEDDVLRDALRALGQFAHTREEAEEEYWQTVAAVREGMADVEAGRMRPARELLEEALRETPTENE